MKPDIRLAGPADREMLTALIARIEAEDHPEDPTTSDQAPSGVRRSLLHYDALDSDAVWFLVAHIGEAPAGLAILVRIPKLDDRHGFLYLDELHVLAEHRRKGIGRALLSQAMKLCSDLGLAGIRLLARPDNQPARALYESVGFHADETMLYQLGIEPGKPQA